MNGSLIIEKYQFISKNNYLSIKAFQKCTSLYNAHASTDVMIIAEPF